jgi:hypothetical protein
MVICPKLELVQQRMEGLKALIGFYIKEQHVIEEASEKVDNWVEEIQREQRDVLNTHSLCILRVDSLSTVREELAAAKAAMCSS